MIKTWPTHPEAAAKALQHIRLVRRMSIVVALAPIPLTILGGLLLPTHHRTAATYVSLFTGTLSVCIVAATLARARLRCPRCEESLEVLWWGWAPFEALWSQLAQQCPHCRLSLSADRDYRWPHVP